MIAFSTRRLVIREFAKSDVPRLFELYGLEETSKYESWDAYQNEADADNLVAHWIEQQDDQSRQEYNFAITKSGSDQLIGICGLDRGYGSETDDPRAAFIGFRLFPSEWNQGYATETLRRLIRWGFEELGLHRIHAGCAAENIASTRVLEKANMRLEGHTRESFPIGDTWSDYLLYGLLRRDYDAHNKKL